MQAPHTAAAVFSVVVGVARNTPPVTTHIFNVLLSQLLCSRLFVTIIAAADLLKRTATNDEDDHRTHAFQAQRRAPER